MQANNSTQTMSTTEGNQDKAISQVALIEEINKLESTYTADEYDAGYKTAVADIMGIISKLAPQ